MAEITDEQLNPALDLLERLREAGGMQAFIMTTLEFTLNFLYTVVISDEHGTTVTTTSTDTSTTTTTDTTTSTTATLSTTSTTDTTTTTTSTMSGRGGITHNDY